jgi:uncharacterized FAD-dependent dehydrogenase
MKYVYVGFGVATTYSVIKLLDNGVNGKDILIIEKGDDIFTRKREDIVSGEGGAGTWSDLKYVYSLTRGGLLKQYCGEEKAQELLNQVKNISHRFHPNPKDIKFYPIKSIPDFIKNSDLEIILTEVEHLGTRYAKDIGVSVHNYFEQHNVNMIFNTEVTDVDFDKKEVWYIKNKEKLIAHYNNLILAMGKSGIGFMNDLVKKYNLETTPKPIQIGVRFESEQKYFQKILDFNYDFKLYKKYNNKISARTFCVNSQNSQVAIEKTYGDVSFNGHSIGEGFNGKINFGIILEVKGIDKPFEYTRELVKNNNINGMGLYYSPGNKIPTVSCRYIDSGFFKSMFEFNENIFDFIKKLNKMFHFNNDYIIYIPEVKYLNDYLEVNSTNLSLKQYPNVFVAGDCLSSRGITVAGAQGIYVSEYFLKGDEK